MGAQLGRTSAAELSKHREACLRFIPTLQKEAKALELPAFVAHHTFFSNEMIEAFAQVVVDNVGTWRELYFGTGLSEIKQEMRSPDSVFVALTSTGQAPTTIDDVQAYLHVQLDSFTDGSRTKQYCIFSKHPHLHLDTVWEIHALEKGKGHGTALLAMLNAVCRTLGLAGIRLTVFPDNVESMKWYERRGFRVAEGDAASVVMHRDVVS